MPRLPWITSFALLMVLARQGLAEGPGQSPCPVPEQPVAGASGWKAGADALLLAPRFESNPAFFVTRRATRGGLLPLNSQSVEEFSYDLSWSPRVWLSYTTESGIGGRLRWFHFDQDANPREAVNPPIPPGSPLAFQSISSTSPLMAIAPQIALPAVNSIQPGPFGIPDRLRFASSLYIDMWDAEAVYSDLRTGNWLFELFGGLRYARIEQHYDAGLQGFPPQFLNSRQTFDGLGPTFGLGGQRGLGDSGFSFYGSGRVSFLFGEDEHVSSGLNIGLIPDFTYAFHDNRSQRQRILPVIDLEMGVEGAYPLGNAELLLRSGVFSQLLPLGSGANGNGNAGLIGLSLGAGIRF